jgi:hypothetical protein
MKTTEETIPGTFKGMLLMNFGFVSLAKKMLYYCLFSVDLLTLFVDSYHRSEIFKLDSLAMSVYTEARCEELLEALLEEAESEHKHTRQTQDHKIPEQTKYFYVRDKISEENSVTKNAKELHGSTDISSGSERRVCRDCRWCLKTPLQALKTGKTKLNKHLDDASLLIAGFMGDGKDTASATANKTTAEGYMSTLRNEIASFESIVKLGVEGHYKPEELHTFAEDAQKAANACSIHIDALKRKMVDTKLKK